MVLQYTPLPSSSHIRVLILLPGQVSDLIRCALATVSLEDAEYDALSYTWGDANVKETIEVDGYKIEVTVNLERALRYGHPNSRPVL